MRHPRPDSQPRGPRGDRGLWAEAHLPLARASDTRGPEYLCPRETLDWFEDCPLPETKPQRRGLLRVRSGSVLDSRAVH
jgi:hypothetical protein